MGDSLPHSSFRVHSVGFGETLYRLHLHTLCQKRFIDWHIFWTVTRRSWSLWCHIVRERCVCTSSLRGWILRCLRVGGPPRLGLDFGHTLVVTKSLKDQMSLGAESDVIVVLLVVSLML